MAGAFSGHLVDSFLTSQSPQRPFGQPSPQITTHGALAFAPSMHGTFSQQSNASFAPDSSFIMSLSEDTAKKIATLQVKLDKKLGPEYISQRPGPGGNIKLTYAEGWKIINLANEVFGFNGWSSSVVNLTTDFIDFSEETKRYTVGVTAIVRVTLRDGVFHEDIGYGMLENSKSKGAALDKCKKEAVTDGVKRALRNFGNLLGNCLYDKAYTQEVVKIKVPPAKFNKDELYRRRECDPNATTSAATNIKTEPQGTGMRPPPLPNHSRSVTGPSAIATPIKSGPTAGPSRQTTPSVLTANSSSNNAVTGLNTPRTTPMHQPMTRPNAGQPSVPRSDPPQAVARGQNDHTGRAHSIAVPPQAAEEYGGGCGDGDDESFMMNSEDDAFYAGIDLGEDEALGGPIDFENGLMTNDMDAGPSEQCLPLPAPANPAGAQHAPQQQQRQLLAQASSFRAEQGEAQPPRRQPAINPSSTASTNSIAASIPSSGSVSTSSRPTPAPSTSNLRPKPESSSQRVSMGGFRFPEGVTPQAHARAGAQVPGTCSSNVRPIRSATAQAVNSGSSAGVGTKRAAEAMIGGAPRTGRSMQGMGLAHPASGAGAFAASTTTSMSGTMRQVPQGNVPFEPQDGTPEFKRLKR